MVAKARFKIRWHPLSSRRASDSGHLPATKLSLTRTKTMAVPLAAGDKANRIVGQRASSSSFTKNLSALPGPIEPANSL